MLDLLKGVSRSFYLSIRLLPRPLREPVGVGYLLARATDTIADAPGLSAGERLAALDMLQASFMEAGPVPRLPQASGATVEEARLLGALPRCLQWLNELGEADRHDVRVVLGHITRGQRMDVERPVLATEAELDEYTYLVAGCVGEFWTKLGFRHIPSFAWLPEDEMLDLGRRYGMGLQLINVLRDARRDQQIGRRYVPAQTDAALWFDRARGGLDAGMRYASAVRNARVRVASALPALVGARTLALVRARGAGVKMPRGEMRGLLARMLFARGSHAALELEFLRQWDNRAR
jgi:farnesyl-diphosphate farnesyltransferase